MRGGIAFALLLWGFGSAGAHCGRVVSGAPLAAPAWNRCGPRSVVPKARDVWRPAHNDTAPCESVTHPAAPAPDSTGDTGAR